VPSYDNINIFGSPLPESMRSGQPNFLSDTISNIPSSAYQLGSDVAQVVTNPVQTLDAIGNLGLGLIALAVPDAYQEKSLDKPQEAALAVGQYISDRYGSVDKAQEALRTDPVGVLADVSGILLGGGYLATKAGLKAGQVATKAGIATDPLVIAGRGVSTALSNTIPTTSGLPSLGRVNELIQEGKVSVGEQKHTDMLVNPTNIDKGKIVDVRRNLATKVNDPELGKFKVQTIHDVKTLKDGKISNAESGIGRGTALSYDPAVTVRSNGVGIKLKVNQKSRDEIASGTKPKFPMAAVRGIYDDVDIFDPDVTLGFNPHTQNIFTDNQGYAVKSIKDGKATIADNDVLVKLDNPDNFKIIKGADGKNVKVFDDLEYYTKDNLPKTNNPSNAKVLPEQAKGITRRDVLKGAGAGLASLAVPMSMMTDVTKAIPPVAKSTGILAGIGKFRGIMDNLSPYLRGSEKRQIIGSIHSRNDVFDRNYPTIGIEKNAGLPASTITSAPKLQTNVDKIYKKYNLTRDDFASITPEKMPELIVDKKMSPEFIRAFDDIHPLQRQLDNAPDKKIISQKGSRSGEKHILTTATVEGVPVMKIEIYKESVQGKMKKVNEELYIPNEEGLAKLSNPKPNLAQGGSINEIDIFGEY